MPVPLTQDQFIEKAKAIHGNKYDYSKVNYINGETKVIITCIEHGDFLQQPHPHVNQRQGCPICKASRGELIIREILDKHNILFETQFKFSEYPRLEYDFYLPGVNIVVGLHGRQHYERIPFFHKTYEDFKESQKRDTFKKELARLAKIPLLEFNYKQLKHLSKKEFEKMLIIKINKINKKS